MADDSSAHPDILANSAQAQLRSIVARVERLEQEKAEIAEQIKEVFAEAKGTGFAPKILRKVIRLRKQDRAKRQEEEALTDLYLSALGELPLFAERAPTPKPAPETTITISTPGGPSVTAPLSVMSQALEQVRTGQDADGELYTQAVQAVRAEAKASVSFIQRKLMIGYNRAASFIERMEAEGLIGPANHAGKREVLAVEARA